MSDAGTYGDQFGIDFQRRILALMARDLKFTLGYRPALASSYFPDRVHQTIAEVVLTHVDKHRTGLSRPVLEELCKKAALAELQDSLVKEVQTIYKLKLVDAAAVKELAVEFGQQQSAINAVLKSADLLEDGKRDKILPILKQALAVGHDLLDTGHRWVEDFEERASWYRGETEVRRVVPTGFEHMDHVMGGGLGVGEIGVILARPKGGKSVALINMAYYATLRPEKLNVVYYTLEVSKAIIATRTDRRIMYKKPTLLSCDPERYVKELRRAIKKKVHGKLIVQQYRAHVASVDTIAAHLDLLKADGTNPDLVIVDYAGLLRPTTKTDALRLDLNATYTELRNLADEFQVPVWTAAQSTTGGFEKETLSMADFAESRGIVAIVDAAWALCSTPDEYATNRCRFFACALRNAQSEMTVEAYFHRPTFRMKTTGLFDPAYRPVESDTVKTKLSDSSRNRMANGGKATKARDYLKDRPRKTVA